LKEKDRREYLLVEAMERSKREKEKTKNAADEWVWESWDLSRASASAQSEVCKVKLLVNIYSTIFHYWVFIFIYLFW